MFSGLGSRLGLTSSSLAAPPPPPPPPINKVAPPDGAEDDNEPPPFPLPDSIQRSKPSSKSHAPPPSPPSFSFDPPGSEDGSDYDSEDAEQAPLPPKRIEKDALAAPTSTTKLGKRVKVSIEPGFSQLDWGRLQRSGTDLRGGVTQLMRITPSMLAEHNKKDDCWNAYGGKVYNVTHFLKYHPGGVPQMMRVAGKDGTELFMKTHAWVNWDLMLEGCLVGFLVRD